MEISEPATIPRVDLSHLTGETDPYPEYAQLRRTGRLLRIGPGSYAVTRYADVASLLMDPRLGSAFSPEHYRVSAGVGPAGEFLKRIMLHLDGPKHQSFRRVLGRFFNAAALQRLRESVRPLVRGLTDQVCQTRTMDAIQDIAQPLPAMVIFQMMAIPMSDYQLVRRYVIDLGKAFATMISDQDRITANAAALWLSEYAGAMVEERRRSPGEDLVSHVLQSGEGAEGWSREDSIHNIIFILFAGFETTSSILSNGFAALCQNPAHFSALVQNPSLIPVAIEEFIRYDPPIQSRVRMVISPIRVANRTIQPGRVLMLMIGSANRDEAKFRLPDEIDISRNPNQHLSFGGGDHVCLGMGLARMEGKLIFEEAVQRFLALRPAGEFKRSLGGPFRGYNELPIEVVPR